ncbi:helix-turn-helix transcriptional regulator [Salinarimonas chemoclinalis]|uniref:helix-turn-helix transcriptional regulator n=1 Tax=Salinarimonas chemoclinalis TaxID=3241599 RepID=UPI003556DAE4
MSASATIDRIREGAVPPDAAFDTLCALATDPDLDAREDAYEALMECGWRAARAGRSEDELIRWHGVCQALAAQMEASSPREAGPSEPARVAGESELDPYEALAERVRAVADLFSVSLHFAEARSAEAVIRRKHVPEVLAMLRERPGRPVDREDIRARLGTGQSNTTRILEMMEAAGLLRREMHGSRCLVTLPDAERVLHASRGEAVAEDHPSSPSGVVAVRDAVEMYVGEEARISGAAAPSVAGSAQSGGRGSIVGVEMRERVREPRTDMGPGSGDELAAMLKRIRAAQASLTSGPNAGSRTVLISSGGRVGTRTSSPEPGVFAVVHSSELFDHALAVLPGIADAARPSRAARFKTNLSRAPRQRGSAVGEPSR